ncbi:DUF1330 domain-containing protein [Alphaproteobacteria bacterium]|nr:DUF1330 domain-containing protein [Alphaproteobacteria bacterium]
MPAYMFVSSKIHDPVRFAKYRKEMQVFAPKYGGKYLARGEMLEVLEGKFDTDCHVLIAEYPSVHTIKKMWNSKEYKEIKKLREGAGDVNIFIIEGEDKILKM